MNWKNRLAAALALSTVLAWGLGCSRKATDSVETNQSRTAQVASSLPTKKTPDPKRPPTRELTPSTKVSAEDLAREIKTDPAAAANYVGKTFTVEGKLKDIKVVDKGTHIIFEGQPGNEGPRVDCVMKGNLKTSPFNYSRGQKLRVEGKCLEANAAMVSLTECSIRGADSDATPKVSASSLITAYRTDAAGDAMYKGKLVRVENAEVEKLPGDGALLLVPFGRIPGSKPLPKKIRVEYDPGFKPLFPQLKEGGLTTIYGRCEGASGMEIVIKDAWFLPYIAVP